MAFYHFALLFASMEGFDCGHLLGKEGAVGLHMHFENAEGQLYIEIYKFPLKIHGILYYAFREQKEKKHV